MDDEGEEERFFPHLQPGTFTAQLLEHAKPIHLHYTSRRVYIGPTPVDWLKSRRSRWVKKPTVSRRAATFTPHATVTEGRRVTALSVPKRGSTLGLEDTGTDAEWESEHEEAGDNAKEDFEVGDEQGVVEVPESRADVEMSEAADKAKRPRIERGDTFRTAHEEIFSEDEDEGEEIEYRSDREGGQMRILPTEPEDAQPMVTEDGPPATTGAHEDADVLTATSSRVPNIPQENATDSLASLINHRKKNRRSTKLKSALKVKGKGGRMPKNTVPRTSTSTPAAKSMVRFNALPQKATSRPRIVKRKALKSKSEQGQIIKMEKMLVRVEATHDTLSDEFNENETLGVVSRVVENWREFLVVCRETGEEVEDADVKLQFYKTRSVPKYDQKTIFGSWSREIYLKRHETRCNMFSTLDKTLVIYGPYIKGNIFYILRPHSVASSVEWFTFIKDCLGWARPNVLEIAMPDLGVNLQIHSPFKDLEREIDKAAIKGSDGNQDEVEKKSTNAARQLVKRSVKLLECEKDWKEVLEYWKKNEVLGLAWRRYDRLEWVYGVNEHRMYGTLGMAKTHELELRPKVHYPTKVTLEDGQTMNEPPPIDGFLVRLTSTSGRSQRFGQIFIRRHFFTTHDNMLFFCKPAQAVPPPPPQFIGNSELPDANEIAEKTPLVYSVTPFAVDENGEVPWLSSPVSATVKKHDIHAYDEAERNVNNVLAADGFIDLTQVEKIRLVPRYSIPPANTRPEREGAEEVSDEDMEEEVFELVMTNKLVLRLQAYNKLARDEWVTRLNDLIKYWKIRIAEDRNIIRKIRSENLDALHVDEAGESHVGQFASKWEIGRSVASPILYNFCPASSCRTITYSGYLYRKPRKHSTFRKCYVILCHGQLLVFQDNFRTWAGTKVPHIQHERYNTLSLENCYVYSGLLTSDDLLDRAQSMDTTTTSVPGRAAFPKIYPDNTTSSDDDTMLTFVVWYGMRRSFVRTRDWQGNTVHRRVTSLGSSGKGVVFKAPSRVLRDLWVMNVSLEIERAQFMRGEEVDWKD